MGFYDAIWEDMVNCAALASDLSVEQQVSLHQQMMCHVVVGIGGGDTFDLEAFRPPVSLWASLNPGDGCNWQPDPTTFDRYAGRLVHWTDDRSPQRAAWLIVRAPSGGLSRQWIPTGELYNCLVSRGTGGPDEVSGYMLNAYMPADSTIPSCSTTTPTPSPTPTSSPTPTTPPPPTQKGYYISDSYLGGTWARTDPNDGRWFSKPNRPPNGAYWYPNGLGVAVDCARIAASYGVRFGDGHTEVWNVWFHVTDGKWIPAAVAFYANSNDGLRWC